MKMQLPPDVLFHHDLRLMVWRPRGIVNEKALNKVITFMGKEEARSQKLFNRFTDALLVEAVNLNFKYMFHISLFRRLSYTGRPRSNPPFWQPLKHLLTIASCTGS